MFANSAGDTHRRVHARPSFRRKRHSDRHGFLPAGVHMPSVLVSSKWTATPDAAARGPIDPRSDSRGRFLYTRQLSSLLLQLLLIGIVCFVLLHSLATPEER